MRLYTATGQRLDLQNPSRGEVLHLVEQEGCVPSVTEVLSIMNQGDHLIRWMIRNSLQHYRLNKNLDAALRYRDTTGADFGSLCHSLCEAHIKGKSGFSEGVTRQHRQAVEPFQRWMDGNVESVIFCEEAFASPKGFGGTCDLLLLLKDGRLLLADLKFKKNSHHFPMTPSLAYRYQLSAYRSHFKSLFGEMGIANLLLATPFGRAPEPCLQVFDYGEEDWTRGFRACLHLWAENYGLQNVLGSKGQPVPVVQ